MIKRGLDQTAAWILALVGAGAVYGGGYMLTKTVSKLTPETGFEHGEAGEAREGEHERTKGDATEHGSIESQGSPESPEGHEAHGPAEGEEAAQVPHEEHA